MSAAALPTVKLELTSSAPSDTLSLEPLRGWLLLRLVEEGYVIVPNRDEAHLALVLERTTEGWSLRVVGAETHSDFVAGTTSSISALEVLHRSVALLSSSQPSATATSSLPARVAVLHVAPLTGTETPKRLQEVHEQLVVELERAGIALAPEGRPEARTLCVEVGESSVAIEAAASSDCELLRQRMRPSAAEALPARIAAIAQSWAPPAPTAVLAEPPPSLPRPTPAPAREQEHPAEPWSLSGHAGLGVSFRDGGNDPLLRIRADAGSPSGLGVRLQGDVLSSGSPSLDITEFLVQGGVSWSLPLTQNSRLLLGALGGANIHHYAYADTDRGTTATWLATLPVETWYSYHSICLGLGVSFGLAGDSRAHQIRGFDIWRRGASMLAVTATLGTSP